MLILIKFQLWIKEDYTSLVNTSYIFFDKITHLVFSKLRLFQVKFVYNHVEGLISNFIMISSESFIIMTAQVCDL